jgi:hypothetical protein
MELQRLKEAMPYKWRVQESKEHGANCVAYIDARDVMDRLDEVVGMGNWQSKYESHNGNLYCAIGIKIGDSWVWKTDCGSESNIEKEKGEASDALKRAAVQWGIGRFLYNLPIERLKTKQHGAKYYPCDDKGNILWSKEDLTAYIQSKGKQTTKTQPQKPETPKAEPPAKKVLPKDKVDDVVAWAKKAGKGIEYIEQYYSIPNELKQVITDKLK